MRTISLSEEILARIEEEFLQCLRGTIKRIKDPKGRLRPFHEALLSTEMVRYSIFERSFSTSLGQRVFQEIAKIIAQTPGHRAEREHVERSRIASRQKELVHEILADLRQRNTKPDWERELNELISIEDPPRAEVEVRSDLWVERTDGSQCFYSIKTVKPNIDQTEIAKRDMLLLKAINQEYEVFLALPYNPYGSDQIDYKYGPPFKIFEMNTDECVLIGKDFWDHIGGTGTYVQIIEALEKIQPTAHAMLDDWIETTKLQKTLDDGV